MRLLEAVGFDDLNVLAQQDPDELRSRLVLANKEHQVFAKVPGEVVIAGWIENARQGKPPVGAAPAAAQPGAQMTPEQFAALAASAPAAAVAAPAPAAAAVPLSPMATPSSAPAPFDRAKMKTFEDINEGRTAVRPLSRNSINEEGEAAGPMRMNAEEKISRRVIRGVEHHAPVALWFKFLTVLLARISFAVAIVWMMFVLYGRYTSDLEPNELPFPTTFVIFLGITIVLGIASLIIGASTRCRICGVPNLMSRRCIKNSKAHPWFPLGHVGGTAVHALIFRWFRCMYCGTPVQLRTKDMIYGKKRGG